MSEEKKKSAQESVLPLGRTADEADILVREWVRDNLSHGVVARNTDAWNELQAALPALVEKIVA